MKIFNMKNITVLCLLCNLVLLDSISSAEKNDTHKLTPVDIEKVEINSNFWQRRFDTWRNVTVFDILDKLEKDGAFRNFDRIAGKLEGEHEGSPWYDGLVYETIRGASDLLIAYPDTALKARLGNCVAHIVDAAKMCPDGYLMTYTQLKEPEHRWGLNGGSLKWQHDIYNAGAMIEAGIHYYRATKNTNLLKAAVALADHMTNLMGESPKQNIIPAHALPEESLVSLYLLFNSNHKLAKELGVKDYGKKYLELSEFWLENRGNYEGGRQNFGTYAQDHISVFEQDEIKGHAVRAVLMCTGLAAAAIVNDDQEYISAAQRLWKNMAGRKMHITGGVGAFSDDEKFGPDYILPNDAYLETCAAVGAGFFHDSMNRLMGDACYADELERVMFNNVLNGVSVAGTTYYYQNPLETNGHHRWDWHHCPCCPPMFMKFIGSLPGYIYSTDRRGIYINQFIGSRVNLNWKGQAISLVQQTEYPQQETVTFLIQNDISELTLFVRIPGWARGQENPYGLYDSDSKGYEFIMNGKPLKNVLIERGYAVIDHEWKKEDRLELKLPMKPRRVYASDEVEADTGLVAIQSGPLVYCLENLDNPDYRYTYLPDSRELTLEWERDVCGGINVVTAKGCVKNTGADDEDIVLKAIPFYCQDNRPGGGSIRVWLPRTSVWAESKPVKVIAD